MNCLELRGTVPIPTARKRNSEEQSYFDIFTWITWRFSGYEMVRLCFWTPLWKSAPRELGLRCLPYVRVSMGAVSECTEVGNSVYWLLLRVEGHSVSLREWQYNLMIDMWAERNLERRRPCILWTTWPLTKGWWYRAHWWTGRPWSGLAVQRE